MTPLEISAVVGSLLQSAITLQQVAATFNQANAEGRDVTEAEKAAAREAAQSAIDLLAGMP